MDMASVPEVGLPSLMAEPGFPRGTRKSRRLARPVCPPCCCSRARTSRRGVSDLSPRISRLVVEAYLARADQQGVGLTSRERQVLELVGEGQP
jgi:hypothetical protein